MKCDSLKGMLRTSRNFMGTFAMNCENKIKTPINLSKGVYLVVDRVTYDDDPVVTFPGTLWCR